MLLRLQRKIVKDILIEFIKKKTAMEFFNKLNECSCFLDDNGEKQIELMTGDDNSIDRNTIIKKLRMKIEKKI